MGELIKINEADFTTKTSMCSTTAKNLMSRAVSIPSVSSNSMTIYTYTSRLTDIMTLITQYKTLLENDLSALSKAKQELIEADQSASQGF